MVEGVEKRLAAEVEGVVVGQRYAVHAEQGEHFGGRRRGPEEERLSGIRPRPPAGGDAAFEVDEGEVPLAEGGNRLAGEERGGRRRRQDVGNPPPQHRVAGEHELHHIALPHGPGPETQERGPRQRRPIRRTWSPRSLKRSRADRGVGCLGTTSVTGVLPSPRSHTVKTTPPPTASGRSSTDVVGTISAVHGRCP